MLGVLFLLQLRANNTPNENKHNLLLQIFMKTDVKKTNLRFFEKLVYMTLNMTSEQQEQFIEYLKNNLFSKSNDALNNDVLNFLNEYNEEFIIKKIIVNIFQYIIPLCDSNFLKKILLFIWSFIHQDIFQSDVLKINGENFGGDAIIFILDKMKTNLDNLQQANQDIKNSSSANIKNLMNKFWTIFKNKTLYQYYQDIIATNRKNTYSTHIIQNLQILSTDRDHNFTFTYENIEINIDLVLLSYVWFTYLDKFDIIKYFKDIFKFKVNQSDNNMLNKLIDALSQINWKKPKKTHILDMVFILFHQDTFSYLNYLNKIFTNPLLKNVLQELGFNNIIEWFDIFNNWIDIFQEIMNKKDLSNLLYAIHMLYKKININNDILLEINKLYIDKNLPIAKKIDMESDNVEQKETPILQQIFKLIDKYRDTQEVIDLTLYQISSNIIHNIIDNWKDCKDGLIQLKFNNNNITISINLLEIIKLYFNNELKIQKICEFITLSHTHQDENTKLEEFRKQMKTLDEKATICDILKLLTPIFSEILQIIQDIYKGTNKDKQPIIMQKILDNEIKDINSFIDKLTDIFILNNTTDDAKDGCETPIKKTKEKKDISTKEDKAKETEKEAKEEQDKKDKETEKEAKEEQDKKDKEKEKQDIQKEISQLEQELQNINAEKQLNEINEEILELKNKVKVINKKISTPRDIKLQDLKWQESMYYHVPIEHNLQEIAKSNFTYGKGHGLNTQSYRNKIKIIERQIPKITQNQQEQILALYHMWCEQIENKERIDLFTIYMHNINDYINSWRFFIKSISWKTKTSYDFTDIQDIYNDMLTKKLQDPTKLKEKTELKDKTELKENGVRFKIDEQIQKQNEAKAKYKSELDDWNQQKKELEAKIQDLETAAATILKKENELQELILKKENQLQELILKQKIKLQNQKLDKRLEKDKQQLNEEEIEKQLKEQIEKQLNEEEIEKQLKKQLNEEEIELEQNKCKEIGDKDKIEVYQEIKKILIKDNEETQQNIDKIASDNITFCSEIIKNNTDNQKIQDAISERGNDLYLQILALYYIMRKDFESYGDTFDSLFIMYLKDILKSLYDYDIRNIHQKILKQFRQAGMKSKIDQRNELINKCNDEIKRLGLYTASSTASSTALSVCVLTLGMVLSAESYFVKLVVTLLFGNYQYISSTYSTISAIQSYIPVITSAIQSYIQVITSAIQSYIPVITSATQMKRIITIPILGSILGLILGSMSSIFGPYILGLGLSVCVLMWRDILSLSALYIYQNRNTCILKITEYATDAIILHKPEIAKTIKETLKETLKEYIADANTEKISEFITNIITSDKIIKMIQEYIENAKNKKNTKNVSQLITDAIILHKPEIEKTIKEYIEDKDNIKNIFQFINTIISDKSKIIQTLKKYIEDTANTEKISKFITDAIISDKTEIIKMIKKYISADANNTKSVSEFITDTILDKSEIKKILKEYIVEANNTEKISESETKDIILDKSEIAEIIKKYIASIDQTEKSALMDKILKFTEAYYIFTGKSEDEKDTTRTQFNLINNMCQSPLEYINKKLIYKKTTEEEEDDIEIQTPINNTRKNSMTSLSDGINITDKPLSYTDLSTKLGKQQDNTLTEIKNKQNEIDREQEQNTILKTGGKFIGLSSVSATVYHSLIPSDSTMKIDHVDEIISCC